MQQACVFLSCVFCIRVSLFENKCKAIRWANRIAWHGAKRVITVQSTCGRLRLRCGRKHVIGRLLHCECTVLHLITAPFLAQISVDNTQRSNGLLYYLFAHILYLWTVVYYQLDLIRVLYLQSVKALCAPMQFMLQLAKFLQ